MNRITEVELAGSKYPLNFSAKAARLVADRYGDLSKVSKAFENKSISEAMTELIWLLALLMEQGAAYKKLIDNEEVRRFTEDELEVVIGIVDISDLKTTLFASMLAGTKQTVEVADEKNAVATQSE